MLSWTFIRFEISPTPWPWAPWRARAASATSCSWPAAYYNIHEVGLIVYLCLAVAVWCWKVAATQLRKRHIVQH